MIFHSLYIDHCDNQVVFILKMGHISDQTLYSADLLHVHMCWTLTQSLGGMDDSVSAHVDLQPPLSRRKKSVLDPQFACTCLYIVHNQWMSCRLFLDAMVN